MVIRTIKLKENAFHALNMQKRSGESYSDVILRVIGQYETSCTKNKKNV